MNKSILTSLRVDNDNVQPRLIVFWSKLIYIVFYHPCLHELYYVHSNLQSSIQTQNTAPQFSYYESDPPQHTSAQHS
jgi:hypothetical protein